MSKAPKKTLSLEDKVKAIRMYDQTQSSRKVASEFGVGKDQIQRLVK
jgi:transposase-like protein